MKMKKSPAKLKEVGKIMKAQLKGKKITVVDGGSKMAKKAKADYERDQAKKKAKADKKAEFKRVKAENIAKLLAISCQSFSPLKLSLTDIRFSILAIVVSSSRNSEKSSRPSSSFNKE